MMYFSIAEIFLSLLYASIFGGGFFLFYIVVKVLKREVKKISFLPGLLIRYDKILEKPTINRGRINYSFDSMISAILAIIYSLGFLLLSYYALDGCLRIYLLFVSLAAFLIPKKLLTERLLWLTEKLFDSVFYLVTILLRIAIFPFLRLVLRFKAKKHQFCPKNNDNKTRAILDKNNIKC